MGKYWSIPPGQVWGCLLCHLAGRRLRPKSVWETELTFALRGSGTHSVTGRRSQKAMADLVGKIGEEINWSYCDVDKVPGAPGPLLASISSLLGDTERGGSQVSRLEDGRLREKKRGCWEERPSRATSPALTLHESCARKHIPSKFSGPETGRRGMGGPGLRPSWECMGWRQLNSSILSQFLC